MPSSTVQLLTVRQAAETLGLSRSKVYELLAAGELASVRIGRTRRVALDDLERFVDRHRTPDLATTTPNQHLDRRSPRGVHSHEEALR